jgi:hypothetical protein
MTTVSLLHDSLAPESCRAVRTMLILAAGATLSLMGQIAAPSAALAAPDHVLAGNDSPSPVPRASEDDGSVTELDCDNANEGSDPGVTEVFDDAVDQECDGVDIDTDGDGLLDSEEAALGTDPELADTDGDGLSDGAEVNTHGTDPLAVDKPVIRTPPPTPYPDTAPVITIDADGDGASPSDAVENGTNVDADDAAPTPNDGSSDQVSVDVEVVAADEETRVLGVALEAEAVEELAVTGVNPLGALASAVGLLGAGTLLAWRRGDEDDAA